MADEYQIAQVAAEVLLGGGGEARIAQTKVEVLHGDQASQPLARIVAATAQVLHSDQSSLPNALIFHAHVEVLTSTIQLISPVFAVEDEGEPQPVVFGVDSVFAIPPIPEFPQEIERNPYPSTVAGIDLDEQQRVLREQHNATQAGDSTFDYGLLLRHNPDQQFTLGSLGRFYHPQFGMIRARYVKLTRWQQTLFQGCPVGRLSASRNVDWTVTNDLTKSSADLAMGMVFFAESPPEGSYGWMVVDGPNPTIAQPSTGEIPVADAGYAWAETGKLGLSTPGKVIARTWGGAGIAQLAPGFLYVKVDGLTEAGFEELVTEAVTPLSESNDLLLVRLGTVESLLTGLATTTNTLAGDLQAVSNRLAVEAQARVRDIQSVRLSAGGGAPASGEINAALNLARNEFRAADEAIRVSLAGVNYKAERALSIAGASSGTLAEQVEALTNQFGGLSNRLVNFNVDYGVPASGEILLSVVTTGAEGSPIVSFEGVAFALENLGDVDVTTVPPADGDSLVWDASASAWVPDAVSGGGGGGGAAWSLAGSWTYSTPVANVDFTGLAGQEILIIVQDVTVSVSGVRAIQVSVDNGASFYGTSGDYQVITAAGAATARTRLATNSTSTVAARSLTSLICNAGLNGVPKLAQNSGGDANVLFVASLLPIDAIRVSDNGGGNLTGGSIFVMTR